VSRDPSSPLCFLNLARRLSSSRRYHDEVHEERLSWHLLK
jgi:hypothetical protein